MGATVEILQTTNISSKVAAIGGLPKSVFIQGVSGDGSVVVGQFKNNQAPYDWQFFRFTRSSGIENLGTMWGKTPDTICISADGLVIAGTFYSKNDGSHIFRYTQSDGLQELGTVGQKSIAVHGVSADGSVIVGRFLHSLTPENSPRYHAFRYSQSQGFEDLGTMGAESAFAHGVSADGSFIVGNFHVANSSDHAFRYSRSDGVRDIGAVGGVAAFATGISNDGSVIVGMFFGKFSFFQYAYYNHAFIYTKIGGVQKLGAMSGRSVGAPSIAADGTKIFGSYTDSNGDSYAYTAKIVLPVTQERK
jgi:probable HAF family extracellular repeat protein